MELPPPTSPTDEEPVYTEVSTPQVALQVDQPFPIQEPPTTPSQVVPKPTWVLYASCAIVMVLPLQYGWSTSQLNYFKFNKLADCDRRPVTPGTCIMFPGHTKLEWIFVVNAWVFGGMWGALFIGGIADKFGRKRALQYVCSLIIVGAILQTTSYNLWQFVVGRFIAGLASGAITGNVGSYNNEVAPPYLRSPLGAMLQSGIGIGIVLVMTTHWYLDFEEGWRVIAGFPIVLASIFLVCSVVMVESPVWLLLHGRRDEAIAVLAKLYGEEHVPVVLTWIEPKKKASPDSDHEPHTPFKDGKGFALADCFGPKLRMQFMICIVLAIMQKFTGINSIFYYSSDLFAKAGLKNPRLAALITGLVHVLPCFVSGVLARFVGNRRVLLVGLVGMIAGSVGITVGLNEQLGSLTIAFVCVFVLSFALSVGPLAFAFIADIFPDYGRATVSSISICIMWLANLAVGVGFPYMNTALKDNVYIVFAAIQLASLLFSIVFVPSTTGKTNAEIQEEFRIKREGKMPVVAADRTESNQQIQVQVVKRPQSSEQNLARRRPSSSASAMSGRV